MLETQDINVGLIIQSNMFRNARTDICYVYYYYVPSIILIY